MNETERNAPTASLTCTALWALYEAESVAKTADPERAKSAWKALSVHFGDRTPQSITQAVVDEYVRKREAGAIGRGAKRSTIWFELAKLTASWNHAAERRPAAIAATTSRSSTCWSPRPRAIAGSGTTRSTPSSTPRLLRARRPADEVRAVPVARARDCSRRGAIEALTWKQVDFDTRVIHYLPDGAVQTSKRKASVPISDALLTVLRRAYDERKGPYVLDGTSWIYDELRRVAAAAGIEGLTPHVLRHTAATIMARNGVDLWIIAGILGNTVAMVEKVYAKHNPDHGRGAVNTISAGRLRVVG
jgi:integrase